MNRQTLLTGLFAGVLLVPSHGIETHDPGNLTVHEWGTFTSIAGEDGQAVRWRPDIAPPDLPCFVDRIQFATKPDLAATVRMETPVVYFYASQDLSVDVRVRFRQGLVTEWFPRATVTPSKASATPLGSPVMESTISWDDVKVSPRAEWRMPSEPGPSHYYAARETDAAPIEVAGEREKFLFYRGIGSFAPPIAAIVDAAGRVRVTSPAGAPLGHLILFENAGGTIRFGKHHAAARSATLDAPSGTATLPALRRALEQVLVGEGLYPKEAAAMVETWRDSWFEEGTRLFYIAPRASIDDILPLEVTPAPIGVARVFVGRMELVTPRTLREVRRALDTDDRATLQKYGRFLEPLTARLVSASAPADREALAARVRSAYRSYYASVAARAVCR